MTRTQIQLPEPLFGRLRTLSKARDISVAELIRRGMELYVMSFPDVPEGANAWRMPVLRGSGGHLVDPATIKAEALAIEDRNSKAP